MVSRGGRGRLGRALHVLRAAEFLRAIRRAARSPATTGRSDPKPGRDMARDSTKPLARLVADQLFSRISGVDRSRGNALRLLRDGAENYPAWLQAIAKARIRVHFENYIIRDDHVGRDFAEALSAKAREGVPVRLLYDWLGCLPTRPGLWRRLRRAGVEVRCFNRPRIDSPFGWFSRNHRKALIVDGAVAFVSGLCVADVWRGDPARHQPAWRDTGIELRGPAVADVDAAFAQSWSFAGGAAPDTLPTPEPQGSIALRVIGSRPNTMGLYRADQMVAALARRRLWLTDAYFVGTTAYIRALIDAAADGVDVRLLVPGASDLPVAKALSRAGYRPLLEAGIRVFEWSGPMLHAKTAVADGRWARIGSSNLNLASWMGNWELDVIIEDAPFAAEVERMFEQDQRGATEIVLEARRVPPDGVAYDVHSATPKPRRRPRRGSPGRLAAGAVGLGSTVTAAITNHRALGPAEATVMLAAGAILLVLATFALVWPRLVTIPLAVLCGWVAVTLLARAARLRLVRPGLAHPEPAHAGPAHAEPGHAGSVGTSS